MWPKRASYSWLTAARAARASSLAADAPRCSCVDQRSSVALWPAAAFVSPMRGWLWKASRQSASPASAQAWSAASKSAWALP